MDADGKEEKSNLTKHDGNNMRDAGLYKPQFLLLFLFVLIAIGAAFQLLIMIFFCRCWRHGVWQYHVSLRDGCLWPLASYSFGCIHSYRTYQYELAYIN
jgi:hypothetical protein